MNELIIWVFEIPVFFREASIQVHPCLLVFLYVKMIQLSSGMLLTLNGCPPRYSILKRTGNVIDRYVTASGHTLFPHMMETFQRINTKPTMGIARDQGIPRHDVSRVKKIRHLWCTSRIHIHWCRPSSLTSATMDCSSSRSLHKHSG
jgi:hypothetical protein